MTAVSAGARVLVVSAGMGAGHHAAAAELARRVRSQGGVAERIDVLELGRPGQGRRLQTTYALLLRWLPGVYDVAMRVWARRPRLMEGLTARGAAAYERGLTREIARFDPDVVVSVYNLASQALGRMRRAGRLDVPLLTYVTDPGPHPYWIHAGVDLHLATLPATAAALEAWGARPTVRVAPLVAPRFRAERPGREEARRRLGLPAGATIALVAAGSWAAGRVEQTVHVLAGAGDVLPVTLCGRDEALRRRLAARGAGLPVGWTDDMVTLMAAADVLVDNAGGLTCWEALACGLPVVLFQPLPGHGRLNAEALEAAELAHYARSPEELAVLVRSRAGGARADRVEALFAGDAVDPVLEACGTAVGRAAR